jgi:anti-sigma B factor antagonist
MDKNMDLKVDSPDKDNKIQVVYFEGEFDKAGFSEIKDELEKTVKGFDQNYLIFDFTKLKFINSEGIGYLMEIHNLLSESKKDLVIIGVNAHVKDVLAAVGIAEVIAFHASLEAFLNKNKNEAN